ncbi:hypothetical protein [Achromobacter anxifer]|uniref:hypothetical protein n=1 Tax=Achromobacter anxifer TaxID=1287737 RepID=UPI0023F7828F|nr:hypothetical protein [Achromobacter anxifer]
MGSLDDVQPRKMMAPDVIVPAPSLLALVDEQEALLAEAERRIIHLRKEVAGIKLTMAYLEYVENPCALSATRYRERKLAFRRVGTRNSSGALRETTLRVIEEGCERAIDILSRVNAILPIPTTMDTVRIVLHRLLCEQKVKRVGWGRYRVF